MSRAGRKRDRRVYWGCTTLGGCDTAEARTELSRDLTHCPECEGALAEITLTPLPDEAAAVPAVDPEAAARAERAYRAEYIYRLCSIRIVEKYPSLWKGEVIGASIAEQWLRNVALSMARYQQLQAAGRELASGLVVPT